MRQALRILLTIWLVLMTAGAVLGSLGALSELTLPPHSGANIGGSVAFMATILITACGLVVALAAGVVAVVMRRADRRIPVLPGPVTG